MIMERLGMAEAEELYDRHLNCLGMGLRCPDLSGEPCWFCEDDDCDSDDDDDWEEEEEEEEEAGEGPPRSGPATFCGFKKSFLCPPSAPVAPACDAPEDLLFAFALPQKQPLTAEEAERNAEELVAEEERIKKKAEKKRMKKKRQKDRRRQEKLDRELKAKHKAEESSPWRGDGQNEDSLPSTAWAGTCSFPGSEEESSIEASLGESHSRRTEAAAVVEEELDLSSTFVSKARLKAGTKPLPPKKEKTLPPGRKDEEEAKQEVDSGPALRMTPVDQSMVLADCGTETAKQGRYQEAVLLFTEAVKLNPREYRFFGNRSFCYERLHCYAEALRDAELALSLQPGWPKGLFRQGKALMGLKRYVEAARTFQSLLHWGDVRGDAAVQLRRCQVQHLLENGFSSGPPDWNPLPKEAHLLLSGGQQSSRRPTATPSVTTSVCGNSGQPEGDLASLTLTRSGGKLTLPSAVEAPVRACFPVWVGNLTPRITQDVLLRHFQPFGPIHSIRHLPRRFCAFINYVQKEAAEAAFATLQGAEVEGSTFLLQLKHPLHATPAHAKVPSSSLQPLKWDPAWNPPTLAASSWLHSVGHLP